MTAQEIGTVTAGPRWDLDVFVAGQPAPKGSTKAYVRGKRAVIVADNRESQKDWTTRVLEVVRATWGTHLARAGIGETGYGPVSGPVRVEIDFVMKRRASAPKTRTPAHTRKPDGDKLTRCVWDCLTHTVIVDDAQVVEWSGSKREAEPGETPGAHIRVRLLDERA